MKGDHPRCTLGSIIDPGQYYVLSTEKEHISEVELLEKTMTKEMKGLSSSAEFSLCCQMCVAVKDLNTGYFRRGVIERQITDNLYGVFLIDYGYTVEAKKQHLNVITNNDLMKLEPLSFTLVLYGLMPSKTCTATGVKKIKASMEWSPEAKNFVESLFKDNPQITAKMIVLKGRTVYGDLNIKRKHESDFVSLRKLLHKNNMCAYSESIFLRVVGLDVSAELSSKEKMDLVKKWQKKNFCAASGSESDSKDAPATVVSHPISSLQRKTVASYSKTEGEEESPGTLGRGRGSLRKLISEVTLKKKNETDERRPGLPKGGDSSLSWREPRKVGIGRGELLRRVVEGSRKSHLTSESPLSLSSASQINCSEEPFPETDSKSEGKRSENTETKLLEKVEEVSQKVEVTITDEESPVESQPHAEPELKKFEPEIERKGMTVNGGLALKQKLDDRGSQSKLTAVNDFWVPFVKFTDSVIEPVNVFRELPIEPSIIWNLEKGGSFNNLSQVQRWAIPAIRKQHNTIVIGGPKTGKTLSYVIPLMDYVQDKSFFDELPDGNGPFVVIMASGSHVCSSIYHLCQSLLRSSKRPQNENCNVRIILAHGGGCEKEVWVDLTNGCDVLITTPHCLVRLLEMPVLTNFERLTCLVLDEVDVISQKPFFNSIRIIMEKAKFNTKDRHFQKILCGERWTNAVENLVKTYVKSHALVIGSYLEAVVYDKLKPTIVLVEKQQKTDVLISKIKERLGKGKILVFCESPSEAIFLKTVVNDVGIACMVAHENLMGDELRRIGQVWNNSQAQWVLVLTDEVLSEVSIKESQALIHYSLPATSKTNFYLRYSTFRKYLGENSDTGTSQDKKRPAPLSDVILVDDENHSQLPHIMEFVTRLGGKPHSKILTKCKEIRRLMEVEKIHSPICENLLAFGRCRNSRACARRHAFVKALDSPGSLPTRGWVNFKVVKVHDASSFSARLIEHVDVDEKVSKISCNSEIFLKLAEFYRRENNNRRPHGVPKRGDVCAIKTEVFEQQVFLRAEVVEYLKLNKHQEPVEVVVRLMDEGGFRKLKSAELYELPKELSECPPVAVDLRLVGVQPLDFDTRWSKTANNLTENLMFQKLEENQYWSGKIVLSLKDTLFLDPVKRKQFLPLLNTHVFDLVLQEELMNNKVAVKNQEHLPSLVKLCAEEEMEMPTKEEIKQQDCAKVQPQWAFFDEDFLRVRFLAAEITFTVFLQPLKFEKLLKDLEEDCQKEGERTAQEMKARKAKNSPHLSLSAGEFCLARFEDGKWNRARIEDVQENRFSVFFVDHGDFLRIPRGDVLPISQTLLLRLPCQAIECRLAGIKEGQECSMEVLREIYGFSNDGKEALYAYVARKDLKPEVTNGRKYSLNLLNSQGISLNKWLVEQELATADESERSLLEDIEVVMSEGEDEEREKEEEEEEGINEEEPKEEQEEEKDNSDSPERTGTQESVPPVQNGLQGSLEGFTDEMFNSEEGQAFLKEFASKFFPELNPVKEAAKVGAKERERGSPPAVRKEGSSERKPTAVDKRKHLMELHKKRVRKVKRQVELKGRDGVLTPRVLWSQNQLEIQLKILLGNVEDYSLECTASNFSFRCFLGEKFYSVDFKLYGAINPQMTTCIPKAFHVLLTLTKLVFPLWPRLQRDEGKFWWINLDVDSLVDKEGPFADKIKSVKRAIETGRLKKAIRGDRICEYTDSEDSDWGGYSGSDSSPEDC